jgi:CRISPR-associated protein Csc3
LGLSFKSLFRTIYNIIQRRTPDPADLDSKVRDWAQRAFEKNRTTYPNEVEQIKTALSNSAPLVSTDVNCLRLAELIRTYYIFLSDHFAEVVSDGWLRIYQLLDLPEAQWNYYAYFDARWARAYALSRELTLSEENLYRRIEADGEALMGGTAATDDPRVELFIQYLNLYALFSGFAQTEDRFTNHLKQYVTNQHQQCVYCSSPFPTDKWMAADVRSDITVQAFSNRLRGGGGEPKKYICAICQLQFLLEKLNYPEVRDEKTLYLHLYPYSFLTEPFIQGLNGTIRNILTEDTAVQALNLNVVAAVEEYLAERVVTPTFRSRTAKDRPQPYGLYLPRYAETMGSLLIFPINPAGDNDTERFLFAFWNAMVLQRHFGVKVLMSDMAIPPLGKDEIPDLYVDNIPLGCRGLLPQNDYAQYAAGANKAGPLAKLWETIGHLFALRRLTFSTEDQTPRLVRALAGKPLTIFYETEKLLEARLRGQEQTGGLLTWLTQQAFPHVTTLAMNQGADFMTKLSHQLERLAVITWQNKLIGRSLEKSSLLFALNEVFQKLNYTGAADQDSLKAATIQDIFDHLSRITPDGQPKPGRKKWEAVQAFVNGWFDDVLNNVYSGNRRKFVSDEKLIRSAFHFYIRQQIPNKAANGEQLLETD